MPRKYLDLLDDPNFVPCREERCGIAGLHHEHPDQPVYTPSDTADLSAFRMARIQRKKQKAKRRQRL